MSEGRYRLSGLGGACTIDVALGANREADVVIRLDDAGTCAFQLVAEHGDGEVTHDEPSVLVAPDVARAWSPRRLGFRLSIGRTGRDGQGGRRIRS